MSVAVDKAPCPACRENGRDSSGDNLVIYDDGHGHCFSCGHREEGDVEAPTEVSTNNKKSKLIDGELRPLLARKITEDTCRKFRYRIGKRRGKKVQIAPYYRDGKQVAQKLRTKDKKFEILGDAKAMGLFGQHLWGSGGRKVVVTEGEIDCMTVSQLQDNRWPVVSVPNGAQSAKKSVRQELEWLETFDQVIFMFDMDDPGQEAARECAELMSPGKAKIAVLPLKDPNKCLMEGQGRAVLDAMWKAEVYRPDGIVVADDALIAEAEKPIEWGIPWCFPTLTEITYGRREGELYTLGAGTGVGKTDILTQQIMFDIFEVNEPMVGVIMLEQKPIETLSRIAGKWAGKTFHVPGSGWEPAEKVAALRQLKDRVAFYDSWGETDWEVVRNKIRYMAVSLGIRLIYVDHLTAMAESGQDERGSLEEIMKSMAGLAQELGVVIHLVSHLTTPDGKPHEEGGRVMIRHFKGSRAIGFWSHYMFGLERDQQDEDEERRHTTTFRVLKDRYTGQATGRKFGIKYEPETGLLEECELVEKSCPFPKRGGDGVGEF